MARPISKRANLEALSKLKTKHVQFLDTRPLVAYVMRYSGCTFTEIATLMDCTRQMAQTLVEKVERELVNE